MDRSLGTAAAPRIKDCTKQIQDSHLIYGASDNTNPAYSSANRSLNYATGGSIHRPEIDRVTVIPYALNYSDSVGLFGKENHFIRVDVNINQDIAFACFEEPGWQCAMLSEEDAQEVNYYSTALIDEKQDLQPVNDYDPANIVRGGLVKIPDAYVSVELENLKTGNQYIDAWFDVRLYTAEREEHPFDKMYVRVQDFFYIGFHARNTRRLPYNVKVTVGKEYLSGLEAGSMRFRNY